MMKTLMVTAATKAHKVVKTVDGATFRLVHTFYSDDNELTARVYDQDAFYEMPASALRVAGGKQAAIRKY